MKTIVVLGNGRSGTSMTTGILKILGVNMDARENPNEFNPRGDFESMDAYNINLKILRGTRWQDFLTSLPIYEDILKQGDNVKEDIQNFIKSKSSEMWGWKNPETTMTIELYLPYLENPHFVIMGRNPIKTAESIMKMTKIDFYCASKVYNYFQDVLLRFTEKHKDLPKMFLCFEDILQDPIKEAKRLAEFIGLEITKEQKTKIDKFVIR